MPHIYSEKAANELAFWESRVRHQGVLSNDHFEYYYTTHFGLSREFYRDKKILDIGCGPRGSLEWANEASLRVGLDPLAAAYVRLGVVRHKMKYVACGAERIPFPDRFFDVVCSFNSLDHVDDLERVVGEITRVVSPGGDFLLLSDIHSRPTTMEPAAFSWDVTAKFAPAFELVDCGQFEQAAVTAEGFGDIYQSLLKAVPYNHAVLTDRYGILSAKFRRRKQEQ